MSIDWQQILSKDEGRKPPAPARLVAELQRRYAFLPGSFIELFSISNGYAGNIGRPLVMLGSVEQLLAADECYWDDAPEFFMIGSNGGGEAYCFDRRCTPPRVVMMPFVGTPGQDFIEVGRTFEEFIDNCLRFESLFDIPRKRETPG